MNAVLQRLRSCQFTYRIYVSLSIALLAALAAFAIPGDRSSTFEHLFGPDARWISFATAFVACTIASALRKSAGSALRSDRVMSFQVRSEALVLSAPYTLVRNPVYLADLIAAWGIALCMPVGGLIYPLGLGAHYAMIIRYEESMLRSEHRASFEAFIQTTPRLIPTPHSAQSFIRTLSTLRIDRDGFLFNAPYLLFLPGFALAIHTDSFTHAALVGLIGVAHWGYWHVIKGVPASKERTAS